MSAILKEFALAGIVGMAFSIVCLLIKYIPKLISGRMKQSDWLKLLLELVAIVLKAILTKELKSLKTKRTQIHNKMKNPKYSRNLLRIDSKQINLKIRYLGITLNFYLPISQKLLGALITILF